MNNCVNFSFKDTVKFLRKNDNYIILTHMSPDGDTLGAGYALYYGLKQLGKKVEVICPDVIPECYAYFLCETDHISRDTAKLIAVDIADKKLLGSLEQEFGECIDLNIDHHISNSRYAKALYLDSQASATCEMVYDLLKALKVKLNDTISKALYTGIATDTGCFKYSCVTEKTHKTAAALYKYNIQADVINKIMFDTKSKNLLTLERMVLDTAEYHFDDKCMIITVNAEMQRATGCSGTQLEGITNISRSVDGVLAGVTIKQTDDNTYKASIRTYDPLNASEICKMLGGGGHKNAAAAMLKGDLGDVKRKILDAIKQQMEETNAWSSSAE